MLLITGLDDASSLFLWLHNALLVDALCSYHNHNLYVFVLNVQLNNGILYISNKMLYSTYALVYCELYHGGENGRQHYFGIFG